MKTKIDGPIVALTLSCISLGLMLMWKTTQCEKLHLPMVRSSTQTTNVVYIKHYAGTNAVPSGSLGTSAGLVSALTGKCEAFEKLSLANSNKAAAFQRLGISLSENCYLQGYKDAMQGTNSFRESYTDMRVFIRQQFDFTK